MKKKTSLLKYHSLLLFYLIIFLVQACCPNVDQKLNFNILTWTPYRENQELVFRNENQETLIFKIKQLIRTETGHDKVCGSYDIETTETIFINQADTTFQFKVALTQEVLIQLDSYQLKPAAKNLSAMFNSVSEQFVSDDWRDRYLPEISLNGKTYKNVLHIYANSPLPGSSFLEIYYAQNLGLVAFNNFQGVWYYLN